MADRVLVTGARGSIGSVLQAAWSGRFVDVEEADLRDLDAVVGVMSGVEVVVHLGGVADEAEFAALRDANVTATFNVFEAARRCGVRRVVYASSNRIGGFHPVDVVVGPEDPVRPDGLYGVTKAFGEALGRMYSDKFGLEVVCVRIGSFEERPSEPRHLYTWLSHGDAVRLFSACVEAPDVRFAIVYGASANTRGWWDLSSARALGYEPRDDAEAFAGELPGAYESELQGGVYTAPGYGGWAR